LTTHVELTTNLLATPEHAFDVSLDVDVHTSSMSASGESAIAGVMRGGMKLGDQVTWRARHFGLWWRMTSRITEFDRPHRFVDEQVKGPFARFRHEHVFELTGEGTSMLDRIEFAAPFGPVGWVAEQLVLRRYLVKLIEMRNAHIAKSSA
jgi:ligand-binding SRPBCC domain-containing protein